MGLRVSWNVGQLMLKLRISGETRIILESKDGRKLDSGSGSLDGIKTKCSENNLMYNLE